MDKKTRLTKAFNLETPDRPPILGGWLAAPEHIRQLAGCSEEEYWEAPTEWYYKAEEALGTDGLIGVYAPINRNEYRIVDHEAVEKRANHTVDDVLAKIKEMEDPEKVKANFNVEKAYPAFKEGLMESQKKCGDMLWCPAGWFVNPFITYVHLFGYEGAMMTMALHPDKWQKIVRHGAEIGRQEATLRARAIQEGIHPQAILIGEDLCSQRGPMVSPDYLRCEYFPLVEYAIEPLVNTGTKVVWHCDGDCRPILDDLLACGISGLQGFQQECGMDLEWIVKLKNRTGDPLLIFGPMSVTRTLPLGTVEDVRNEVKRAMDICQDKASLVFFTANTMNPDIPLDNIKAYWQAVQESNW